MGYLSLLRCPGVVKNRETQSQTTSISTVCDIDMESGNVDDNQFLFNEAEFEAEDFRAGSFVAKYRRVTTLESIRLQLHQCVEGLKNQLYVIINRDYKDFISIATKLDGVDTRIEFLRKPLVDLRIDLTNVHEGMIATIQAIQDKLQRKTDVTNRRIMLELVIECSDKLDIADEIINGNKRSFQVYTQSRRDLLVLVEFHRFFLFHLLRLTIVLFCCL